MTPPTWSFVATTPLDDFLSGSSSTDTGEMLLRIGSFGSSFGITSAVGLLVFLAVVHRGSHGEVAALLRVIAIAGGIAMLGAAVEIAGVASIGDLSWFGAVADETGSAPMMRLLSGLLIVLGLFDQTVAVEAPDVHCDPPTDPPNDPPNDPPTDAPTDADLERRHDDTDDVRWVPASASAFGMVGVVIGMISFWFDGHTVTRGPRLVHAVVDFAHVAAGSIWFGGVVALCLLSLMRRGRSVAPAILRFSSVAAVALILVLLAGALMGLMIIDGLGDITGTPWGRVLIVKVATVASAALVGGYNHVVVVPALRVSPSDRSMLARARVTIAVEAALLAFVVAVTVLLTSASIT